MYNTFPGCIAHLMDIQYTSLMYDDISHLWIHHTFQGLAWIFRTTCEYNTHELYFMGVVFVELNYVSIVNFL